MTTESFGPALAAEAYIAEVVSAVWVETGHITPKPISVEGREFTNRGGHKVNQLTVVFSDTNEVTVEIRHKSTR